jgi:hypothetical protein
MITFQDRSFRTVHAKFLEAAARDRRTSEIIALDSTGKLQKVAKIDVNPPDWLLLRLNRLLLFSG